MNILIIPDIHGRTFWKKAVEEYKEKVDKIIFLGDYLDPYPWELITRKDAIRNFDDIINFKSENVDKVVLLLGNHCLPYVDKKNFYTKSRYDSSNAYHIEKMFTKHRNLFKLAHEEIINNKNYIFTHSVLLYGWYEKNKELIGEATVDNINKLINSPKGLQSLCQVSRLRGGGNEYGSIVWADVHETPDMGLNTHFPWEYQVFGHSQQDKYPIITPEFACLDCRRAFILNNEGHFIDID